MAAPRFIIGSILVLAFLGVAAAGPEYKKGRSLKPYGSSSTTPPQDESSATRVQGVIACNKGGEHIPMIGALARITCLALSDHGYESAPFSVVTDPTDKNGYFHVNLSKYTLKPYRLSGCKVFLEAPAPGSCNVPTDINNGLSGALLSVFSPTSPHSSLYSVGPFYFLPSTY